MSSFVSDKPLMHDEKLRTSKPHKSTYTKNRGSEAPEKDLGFRDLFKPHKTVIPTIIIPVLIFSTWSTLVAVFYKIEPINFLKSHLDIGGTQTQMISILGVVIGLLLVFRTNTAYERFWEGRKLWSQLMRDVRNFSRMVWINVHETDQSHLYQKRTTINLLSAFCTSVKHNIRKEYHIDYEDIVPFLSGLPDYSPEKMKHMRNVKDPKLPIQISCYIGAYVRQIKDEDRVDPMTHQQLTVILNDMVNVFTELDRIRFSPMPVPYAIHLKQSIYIYLFGMPFQLVASLGWAAVAVVAISSFILLGIEAIGEEIENPFGYDATDLPLNEYCRDILMELNHLISKPTTKFNPSTWDIKSLETLYGTCTSSVNTSINISQN